jgi:hypothetical protein
MEALEKMVTSLERWKGEAKHPGFAFYNLGASCRVGDREVGLTIHLPFGTEAQPDRKLLNVARRMVNSLQPATSER